MPISPKPQAPSLGGFKDGSEDADIRREWMPR